MTLKRETVAALVRIVENDEPSRKQIESSLSWVLPDGAGAAGSVRNFGMAFVNTFSMNEFFDPSEPQNEALVCTGIARSTAAAIQTALKAKSREQKLDPNLALVAAVSTIDRSKPIAHTATHITMKDGSAYVLDWHATLNVANPMVSTEADWSAAKGGVPFDSMPKMLLNGAPQTAPAPR